MDTKNTTASRVPFHDSMPSFMNFIWVLDLLELKHHAYQCFAGNQRCPGVWNSFPFLAWDLSMHPRTQIWFFNQFICTGACACISNLNYAHKMPKNPVNVLKFPNEPWKIPKLNTTLLLFYVGTRKILKAIRGNGYRFVPKGGTFPYRNHHACCDKLWFVRSLYPNLPQMRKKNYHGMLMPLHDSMQSFMNFRRVLDLLEFKNQVYQCL